MAGADEGASTPVARSAGRPQADEWALVLLAEGIAPVLRRREGTWEVQVPAADAERARALLASYLREAAERPPAAPPPAWRGDGPALVAAACALGLLAFHAVTGPWAAETRWFRVGAVDAEAMRHGAPWRAVTALTLHADVPHVVGNALAGGLLLALAGRALGPGTGLLAVLAAGTLGNLANAFLHPRSHLSVGASTAVFGAVGVLAGLAAVRRPLRIGSHPAWVSLAAALGLLAMLGTGGGRTDVWAHGFGLLAGLGVGAALGAVTTRPPGPWTQASCAALAAALVAGSWACALATGG